MAGTVVDIYRPQIQTSGTARFPETIELLLTAHAGATPIKARLNLDCIVSPSLPQVGDWVEVHGEIRGGAAASGYLFVNLGIASCVILHKAGAWEAAAADWRAEMDGIPSRDISTQQPATTGRVAQAIERAAGSPKKKAAPSQE